MLVVDFRDLIHGFGQRKVVGFATKQTKKNASLYLCALHLLGVK